MKQLAIIVADNNPERLRTALVMATAHVALGGSARLFFQGAAVALLRTPLADPDGDNQTRNGLPTLGQLFEEAVGLGIRFTACQSSLALLGLPASDFASNIQWTGMIGFLSTVEPGEQLMVI
ncbi:MAG: DsrE family protein [Sphingomonadaceae bacterium]